MSSPLRNKYAIDIDRGNPLTFQMPLFTLLFRGGSDRGTDIWALMGPSEMEWSILIRPGIDHDIRLVAALAFIHNERWHYG